MNKKQKGPLEQLERIEKRKMPQRTQKKPMEQKTNARELTRKK